MQPLIRFTIITLFPEALRPYLDSSMLFKAQDRGIIKIDYVNLRDFGFSRPRTAALLKLITLTCAISVSAHIAQ